VDRIDREELMRAMCADFVERYPHAPNGPGHIVIDDDNFEPHHIEWCIEEFYDCVRDTDPAELFATMDFLKTMLVVSKIHGVCRYRDCD
jgi:hypothetical protein